MLSTLSSLQVSCGIALSRIYDRASSTLIRDGFSQQVHLLYHYKYLFLGLPRTLLSILVDDLNYLNFHGHPPCHFSGHSSRTSVLRRLKRLSITIDNLRETVIEC